MLSEMLIQLARPHSSDEGIKGRDELILARHNDRGLALLELYRLRPIADRQPDCPKHVFTPPGSNTFLDLYEVLAAPLVGDPALIGPYIAGVQGKRSLLL